MEQSKHFSMQEDLKRLKHLKLPEKKEGYLIPEIVDVINKQLDLKINFDSTKKNSLSKRLRRALKDEPYEKDSSRKTRYATNIVNRILNDENFYEYLLDLISQERAKEMEEFLEYKKRAANAERSYKKFLQSGGYEEMMKEQEENSIEYDMQNYVKEKIYKIKIDCLLDIASHFIKFDEEQAKHDIWCCLTADEHYPTPLEMAADERLGNISNYYDTSIIDKIEKLMPKDKKSTSASK